jgi:rare lipoprotein A
MNAIPAISAELARLALTCLLVGGLGACAAPATPARHMPPGASPAKSSPPPGLSRPWSERRAVLWEGLAAHGRRTASGEIHDMYALSAAHPSLPLGVYASLRNHGRTVVVKINDRSPDGYLYLSHAAARALGLNGQNTPQTVLIELR